MKQALILALLMLFVGASFVVGCTKDTDETEGTASTETIVKTTEDYEAEAAGEINAANVEAKLDEELAALEKDLADEQP